MSILANPLTWVSLAFVTFIGIIWFKGRNAIANGIDQKIAAIRNELEVAANLKYEATERLSEARKRQKDGIVQTEEILKTAKDEVKNLKAEANARLEELILRKKVQTADRISQKEHGSILALRNEMADLSVGMAIHIIKDEFQEVKSDPLVDSAIKQLSKFS